MKAFLLAAGFGKRMNQLTAHCPKPLLPINQIPMIIYVLFQLYLWKVEMLVINLHYLGEAIRKKIESFPYFPIHFITEKQILGTAGGIRNAMDYFFSDNETIIVANSDTISYDLKRQPPPREMCEKHGAHLYLCSTTRLKGTAATFQMAENGRQIHFDPQGSLYYIGISLLHVPALSHLSAGKTYELGDIWQKMAKEQQLTGSIFPGPSHDIGTEGKYREWINRDPIPQELQELWMDFISWYQN